MTYIAAPIPADDRRRGQRAVAEVRRILAAHRPADLDTMRRFSTGRDALGRAVGGAR